MGQVNALSAESSSSRLLAQVDRQQALRDAALLLLRAWLAVVFAYHGSQKLFGWFGGYGLDATAGWMGSIGIPLPKVSAVLAASSEFFGGLLLLVGLLARPAAAVMTFTMLVATWVTSGNGLDARNQGFEYPATLAVVLATLAAIGPGRWTVGRLVGRPRADAAGTGATAVAN